MSVFSPNCGSPVSPLGALTSGETGAAGETGLQLQKEKVNPDRRCHVCIALWVTSAYLPHNELSKHFVQECAASAAELWDKVPLSR